MKILLKRTYNAQNYCIGHVWIDGKFFSDCIEDRDCGLDDSMTEVEVWRKKVYGKTAIPTGTYVVNMNTVSPRLGKRPWAKPYSGIVPRLMKVKGFDGILIHPLNTAEDSYGCLGFGENRAKGMVLDATKYFHRLMKEYLVPAKKRGEQIEIEIVRTFKV